MASHAALGGRRVSVPRLRVRNAEGEVPLARFQWVAARDALEAETLDALAAGLSIRRHTRTLAPVPREGEERGTSPGAVSGRFVALSTARLHALLSRPLGGVVDGGGVRAMTKWS